jgi:hypothetical protein
VDQIRLPDLEVIRRYSIAVRREHAPADEVLEALQADVDMIRRAIRASARASAPKSRSRARR